MKMNKERLAEFNVHFEMIDDLRLRLAVLCKDIECEIQKIAYMASYNSSCAAEYVTGADYEFQSTLDNYSNHIGETVETLTRWVESEAREELKLSKLDQLLKFIGENPGCLRRDIIKRTGLSSTLLNMYLSSHYGYKEGSYRSVSVSKTGRQYSKPAYFRTADHKPAKGRVINMYFLNEEGKARVARL